MGAPLYLKSPATTGSPQNQGGTLYLVSHYPRGVPLHLRSQRTRGVPHNPGGRGGGGRSPTSEHRGSPPAQGSPLYLGSHTRRLLRAASAPGNGGPLEENTGDPPPTPRDLIKGGERPAPHGGKEHGRAPPDPKRAVGGIRCPARRYRQAPRWQGSSRTR